jgi:hypothetical protein
MLMLRAKECGAQNDLFEIGRGTMEMPREHPIGLGLGELVGRTVRPARRRPGIGKDQANGIETVWCLSEALPG